MKTKILIFGLISFLISCVLIETPSHQQSFFYTQKTNFLYNQMLYSLRELGWIIKKSDRNDLTILAWTYGAPSEYREVSSSVTTGRFNAKVTFEKQNNKTNVIIKISQPGETWDTSISPWLVEWESLIRSKFHEKIK